METQLWAIVLVLIAGLVGALGPIYLKKGSDIINPKKIFEIYKNKFLIIGAIIYVVGIISFILALRGGELSILYSLSGLSYAWVCLFSSYMLKEKMNIWKWIGIFMIIVGVSFIGIGASL